MYQLKQGAIFSFLWISVLFRLSTDWMMPTHIGEDDLLYLVYQIKCWSLTETLSTDTLRNNVPPAIWASVCPAKMTHKINHHSHPIINIGDVVLEFYFVFKNWNFFFYFKIDWKQWNIYFLNLLQASVEKLNTVKKNKELTMANIKFVKSYVKKT